MNLAFFDIDKTIYDGYSTPDFVFYLIERGVVAGVAKEKYQKIVNRYQTGEITYQHSVMLVQRLFARHVKGIDKNLIQRQAKEFVDKGSRLFPWVSGLISQLKTNDFKIFFVSAAAYSLVEIFSEKLQADGFLAAVWLEEDEFFSGKLSVAPGSIEKLGFVKSIIGRYRKINRIIAFGDSTADVEMLKMAHQGFVVNPHQPQMIELANKNGWKIIDKNVTEIKIN